MNPLEQAVTNANQIQSPSSPLGNLPELAAMYRSSFQMPAIQTAMQAQGYNADVQVTNQKVATATAKQQAQDMQDASKYRVIKRPDGGFGFYAPNGQEVSASQYAALAGVPVAKVLADSENPIDIQYLQDYDNLSKFMQAVTRGDTTTTDEYYASNSNLQKLTPDQVIQKFKQAYPTIYGPWNGTAGQRLGSTFIPTIASPTGG